MTTITEHVRSGVDSNVIFTTLGAIRSSRSCCTPVVSQPCVIRRYSQPRHHDNRLIRRPVI